MKCVFILAILAAVSVSGECEKCNEFVGKAIYNIKTMSDKTDFLCGRKIAEQCSQMETWTTPGYVTSETRDVCGMIGDCNCGSDCGCIMGNFIDVYMDQAARVGVKCVGPLPWGIMEAIYGVGHNTDVYTF